MKCLRKEKQFLNIYNQAQIMWVSGQHHSTNITGSLPPWPPEIAYKHTLQWKPHNDAWPQYPSERDTCLVWEREFQDLAKQSPRAGQLNTF